MYRLLCVCKDFQLKLLGGLEDDVDDLETLEARRGLEHVMTQLKTHREYVLKSLPGMWFDKCQSTEKLQKWLLHSDDIHTPASLYGLWTTPSPGACCSISLSYC